jgi:1-deoxy-D-xylulose-5-phosphate synthase
MAPKDEAELRDLLLTAIEYNVPRRCGYPRGNGIGVDISSPPKLIEVARLKLFVKATARSGSLRMAQWCSRRARRARIWRKMVSDATVVNARFAKPLDG